MSDSFELTAPPDNELGVAVPLRFEVGRTDDFVFGILGVVAFSTGFLFTLTIRRRVPLDGLRQIDPGVTGAMRLVIHFADGGKSTMQWGLAGPREAPPTLRLISHGTVCGGRSWSSELWAWPLPPPGLIAFCCEWEAESVAELRSEIEAHAILEAAAQVEQLWRE